MQALAGILQGMQRYLPRWQADSQKQPPPLKPDGRPLVSFQNVRFSPEKTRQDTIRSVSLEINDGQIVALLGPSGSGKTTLLRLIAGLERVSSGTITIDGRVVDRRGRLGQNCFVPARQRKVSMMMQSFALFPHMTVRQNIRFALPRSEQHKERRIDELLLKTGTAALRNRLPHTLSGGEQQRIALARALAPKSRLILLDEPFSSLDTLTRRQVRDRTLHLLKNLGIAVVMVTHDPREACMIADKIVAMYNGQIMQIAKPEDMFHQPADLFVMNLFGDVNVARCRVNGGSVRSLFGTVAHDGHPDGTALAACVRPDQIKVDCQHGQSFAAGTGRVMDIRYVEGRQLIHLACIDFLNDLYHVHVERPNDIPQLKQGQIVRIYANPSDIALFDWCPELDLSHKG